MNVKVHIERLVLEGLQIRPGERSLLAAEVETELSRLLAEGGVSPNLAAGAHLWQVPAEGIQVTAGGEPSELGRGIARSLYGGIGK